MKDRRILIFAGTTEGRKLSEYLAQNGARLYICVATAYGESLLPKGENVTVSCKRLDSRQMQELIREYAPCLVVDATHPFACEVTRNIKTACTACGKEYLRLNREEGDGGNCIYVESIEEAVAFLQETSGNILAVTGSKEFAAYTKLENYRERLYARVLSSADAVRKCEELAIRGRHLLCMQGPFSEELNYAVLKEYGIEWMVTKESGKTGGFPEKLAAAERAGVKLIAVGRPLQEKGYGYDAMRKYLAERLEIERDFRPVKISIVGTGTGSADFLTVRAKEICEEAELIIGARRVAEATAGKRQKVFYAYRPEEIAGYIKRHPEYQKIAVVFSGDTGFYSGAKKLIGVLKEEDVLKDADTEVIPGISSVSYFSARIGVSWEDAALASAHGRECNIVTTVRENKKTFLLLGGTDGAAHMCRRLTDFGYGELEVCVGENLSCPDEKISAGKAEELCGHISGPLALLYIYNPDGGRQAAGCGILDESFIRGKVPMTKGEVRAVSLAKLKVCRDSIVYDIGAGTGSVAVEAARLAALGKVYAFEEKEEAAELIDRNKYKFGTENLSVVKGHVPEVLEGVERPDCVFIGGSGGCLKEILRKVTEGCQKVRIVINAVSLETVSVAMQWIGELKEHGKCRVEEEEILQLSVAKAREIGRYHMMTGQNPIFIISMTVFGETI